MAISLGSSIKNNFAAIVAPVVGNDNTEGYSVGSQWIDTVLDESYICTDVSTGAAVWTQGNLVPAPKVHTYSFGHTLDATQGFATAGSGLLISSQKLNETDVGVRQTVVRNATISAISYTAPNFNQNDGHTTTIYVNGAAQGTTNGTNGPYGIIEFPSPVVVVAGDVISLESAESNTSTGFVVMAEGHAAATHAFTGDFQTPGFFIRPNGYSSITDSAFGTHLESVVVSGNAVVGSVNIAYWTESGTAGTTFQLTKNGSPVESFTATGGTGVIAMTTVFATGDTIAIEYDAGVVPGETIITVHIDNPVYELGWAGQPNAAAPRFLYGFGSGGSVTSVSSWLAATSFYKLVCPVAGTVRGATITSPARSAQLYKNGEPWVTLGASVSQVGVVNKGDVLGVTGDTAVNWYVILEITPVPTTA